MGAVRITSLNPKFNGSHFGLPPQQYPQNDWLGGKFPYTMTYAHGPHPRHGLGSRLGWREISTGGTTPMPDSARARCPSGLASLHHSRLSTRSSYQLYSFSGDRRFCYDNHGSFVYDSPNLFCGPSGSVRTGLAGVRSEPGHRTHLTSLFFRDVSWRNLGLIV